jgi:hypothetical protein
MKRFKAAAAGIAAFALILLTACGASSETRREEELRRMAATLVPSASRVIGDEPGGCVEFADFPSCVTVLFVVDGSPSLQRRVDLAKKMAEAEGWSFTDRAIGPGGVELRYERGGFHARIVLWTSPETTCGQRSVRDCGAFVDHIQVVRT